MSELQAFFHMGGYAIYVWPSFLLSLVVLLANVWWSKTQLKRVMRDTAKKSAARHARNETKSTAQTAGTTLSENDLEKTNSLNNP